MKLQNLILIVLGFVPYSLIASASSLYHHAKKNLVDFPVFYNSDSKDFKFYQGYDSHISWSFILTAICDLIWLPMIYAKIYNFLIYQEKVYNVYIIGLGFFGYFTAFFIMRSPILEWYFEPPQNSSNLKFHLKKLYRSQ